MLLDPIRSAQIYAPGGGGGGVETLAPPPQNTVVAKDRDIKLPVFLLAMQVLQMVLSTQNLVKYWKGKKGFEILYILSSAEVKATAVRDVGESLKGSHRMGDKRIFLIIFAPHSLMTTFRMKLLSAMQIHLASQNLFNI